MRHIIHALVFGILLAGSSLLLYFSAPGTAMEENLGLKILFTLRGPRQPPEQTVIINLDKSGSSHLGLSDNHLKWPRTVYARLVEKLNTFGAEVIVFDIHFSDRKSHDEDALFAREVKKAGRVILIEQIKRQAGSNESGEQEAPLQIETLVSPYSPLAESALALAPFPVPKFPVRVNQCWIFKTSAGDIPTLPAVALQAAALDQYDALYRIIRSLRPEKAIRLPSTSGKLVSTSGRLVETMLELRSLFREKGFPELLKKAHPLGEAASSDTLQALVAMYSGGNGRFVNYYGPPATIRTISLNDFFDPDPLIVESLHHMIDGKVVFIGAAGGQWSEQKDGFYTVFSRSDGREISGVELAATVFSNLTEQSSVIPSSPAAAMVILLTSAAFYSLSCFFFPLFFSFCSLLLFCACYLSFSFSLFSYSNTWLPLITPVFIQPPIAYLCAVLHKYIQTRKDKNRIRKALELYIPDSVVREIADDMSDIKTGDKLLYSTCLMTDVENYTTLSEKLSPKDLSVLMKQYYQCIFSEVNRHQGFVCNMIGDSVLALWPSQEPAAALREMGCKAALQILSAVEAFNRVHPGTRLPTRIGLHSGNLLIGNIGADGHFEYAPVGDIVNTNQRIEALNKQLGTKVLASRETVQGLQGILSRELGTYLLGGKTKPVTVHELIPPERISSDEHTLYFELFPEAMSHFKQGRWSMAFELFHECIDLQEHDGPSLFFLGLSHSYQKKEPEDGWNGVVRLAK